MSTSPARAAANKVNALSHGLTARQIILPGEDAEAFAELRGAIFAEYAPATPREEVMAQELAEARWRLLRCRRQEAAFQSAALKQVRRQDPKLGDDEAAAAIFMDPALAKQLSLFLRYQRAIEKACVDALATLTATVGERLQAERLQAMRRARALVSQPASGPVLVEDSAAVQWPAAGAICSTSSSAGRAPAGTGASSCSLR